MKIPPSRKEALLEFRVPGVWLRPSALPTPTMIVPASLSAALWGAEGQDVLWRKPCAAPEMPVAALGVRWPYVTMRTLCVSPVRENNSISDPCSFPVASGACPHANQEHLRNKLPHGTAVIISCDHVIKTPNTRNHHTNMCS